MVHAAVELVVKFVGCTGVVIITQSWVVEHLTEASHAELADWTDAGWIGHIARGRTGVTLSC